MESNSLEGVRKLHELLGNLIENVPGKKEPEMSESLRMIGSAVNISHLLLKWVVDAYDNDIPETELADGIKALKIHIKATDSYAGEATSEEAKHVIATILKCTTSSATQK
jgi:hypothetical protein